MDDAERIRIGDEDAFRTLYLACHTALGKFAYGYVRSRDSAEEPGYMKMDIGFLQRLTDRISATVTITNLANSYGTENAEPWINLHSDGNRSLTCRTG